MSTEISRRRRRATIAELYNDGLSQTEIADRIGVHQSTVARELAQCQLADGDLDVPKLSRGTARRGTLTESAEYRRARQHAAHVLRESGWVYLRIAAVLRCTEATARKDVQIHASRAAMNEEFDRMTDG